MIADTRREAGRHQVACVVALHHRWRSHANLTGPALRCPIVLAAGMQSRRGNQRHATAKLLLHDRLLARRSAVVTLLSEDTLARLRPGERINECRVLCEIATGQLGAVAIARRNSENSSKRHACLKRFHPSLVAEPSQRALMTRRMERAKGIEHRNVVRVEELLADSTVVLQMEYFPSQSLAALLHTARFRRRLVPPAVAVTLLSDACDGVAEVHRAFAHDDDGAIGLLSPRNLLVGEDATVKVAEMVSARVLDVLPSPRAVTGRAARERTAFRAPETVEGAAPTVRGDVFSLGVMLWEALAGEPLFAGDSRLSIDTAITQAPIPPVDEDRADLPAALVKVVHRALARDPAERYATPAALAEALREVLPTLEEVPRAMFVREMLRDDFIARREELFEAQSSLDQGLLPSVPPPEPTPPPVPAAAIAASLPAQRRKPRPQPPRSVGAGVLIVGIAASMTVGTTLMMQRRSSRAPVTMEQQSAARAGAQASAIAHGPTRHRAHGEAADNSATLTPAAPMPTTTTSPAADADAPSDASSRP